MRTIAEALKLTDVDQVEREIMVRRNILDEMAGPGWRALLQPEIDRLVALRDELAGQPEELERLKAAARGLKEAFASDRPYSLDTPHWLALRAVWEAAGLVSERPIVSPCRRCGRQRMETPDGLCAECDEITTLG